MLILVGNRHGLSYYGEASLAALTKLAPWAVKAARKALVEAGLIAYAKPIYQVLDLSAVPQGSSPPRSAPSKRREELTDEERKHVLEELRRLRKELASK
jgi:hypothetical protein